MTNQNKFRKYIDGYIALTEFTKNIFIKYGYKRNKIYIKDNGFIDNKIRRKKTGGYFLFLGRISEEKGIIFLLDFFKEFKQYKLVIAGNCENIDKYKNKYNFSNIIFKGFVDGEKKSKLIQESQALILPSIWYENYPVTITESFCCGIPVIGSNIGGIPFIIKDKKNGLLFEVNNKNSLKIKLDIILKNNLLRDTLGDRARETYLNRMEMSHNIEKLVEIYGKVINEK